MTREEAIEIYKEWVRRDSEMTDSGVADRLENIELYNMAISALKQEPCNAISREAFIKRYDEWMYSEYGKHCEKDALAIRVANSLPPVTPSRRKGHWIHLRCDMYECSECGKIHTSFEIGKCDADYCPKCGVEMEIKE